VWHWLNIECDGGWNYRSLGCVWQVAKRTCIDKCLQARLAAILVTAMLVSFALLVHEPMLLADHSIHYNWTESAENLACGLQVFDKFGSSGRTRTYNPSVNSRPSASKDNNLGPCQRSPHVALSC